DAEPDQDQEPPRTLPLAPFAFLRLERLLLRLLLLPALLRHARRELLLLLRTRVAGAPVEDRPRERVVEDLEARAATLAGRDRAEDADVARRQPLDDVHELLRRHLGQLGQVGNGQGD